MPRWLNQMGLGRGHQDSGHGEGWRDAEAGGHLDVQLRLCGSRLLARLRQRRRRHASDHRRRQPFTKQNGDVIKQRIVLLSG